MGKYFGTDGFRGEANVTLTVDHAFKVGRFLGWYYGKNHENGKAKIVIGKDTRRSSYMFEYSLVAGLTASGADAYLLHVTTTPSVSYVARTEDFDCGIMISASHNPFYDNGIKLINAAGEKMKEDVIAEIEKYLDGELGEIPYATRENIGCTVDYTAGRNRYMGYLMSLAIYSFKGIRVGLDASNGSAWTLAKAVFDSLGAGCHLPKRHKQTSAFLTESYVKMGHLTLYTQIKTLYEYFFYLHIRLNRSYCGGVFYVWKIMGKNHDVCVGIVDNYACVCHDRVFWQQRAR